MDNFLYLLYNKINAPLLVFAVMYLLGVFTAYISSCMIERVSSNIDEIEIKMNVSKKGKEII